MNTRPIFLWGAMLLCAAPSLRADASAAAFGTKAALATPATAGEETEEVQDPNFWTGANSTDWFDPLNWSLGQVPACESTQAVIPASAAQMPAITGGEASTASLTIEPAAQVMLMGGKLMICNRIDVKGSLLTSPGSMLILSTGGSLVPAGIYHGLQLLAGNEGTIKTGFTMSGNIFIEESLLIDNTKLFTGIDTVKLGLTAMLYEQNAGLAEGQVTATSLLANPNTRYTHGDFGLALKTKAEASGETISVLRLTGDDMARHHLYDPTLPRIYRFTATAREMLKTLTMDMSYRQSEMGALPEGNMAIYGSNSLDDPFIWIGASKANGTLDRVELNTYAGYTMYTLGHLDPPLPVAIISLEAVNKGEDVAVNWEVATETQIAGYRIERSDDGRQWTTAGFVASKAAPSSAYSFTDPQAAISAPDKQKIYYRLIAEDVNNKEKASEVVSVQTLAVVRTFTAFPNPFAQNLTLTLDKGWTGTGYITITDLAGRQVLQQQVSMSSGRLNMTGLEYLPAGIYMIRLQQGEKVQQLKVVKN